MTTSEAIETRNQLATDPIRARAFLNSLDDLQIDGKRYAEFDFDDELICKAACRIFDDIYPVIVHLH